MVFLLWTTVLLLGFLEKKCISNIKVSVQLKNDILVKIHNKTPTKANPKVVEITSALHKDWLENTNQTLR